jgi:hypothetical protein
MPLEHHEQELPNSCVAASVRMLQLHAGKPALGEPDIRKELGPHPLDLDRAASFGRVECLEFNEAKNVEWLRAVVQLQSCAVTIAGGAAASWAKAAGLTSRHGALSSPPPRLDLADYALPRHVVVVVGAERDRVRYLDPFFPAEGQPLDVPLIDFVRGLLGYALLLDT